MFSTMQTPETRAEFEERMNFLVEQLKSGQMRFAPGLRIVDSLTSVRYLPNRRIDLLSIDESARLQANMAFQMRDTSIREKLMGVAGAQGTQGASDAKGPKRAKESSGAKVAKRGKRKKSGKGGKRAKR